MNSKKSLRASGLLALALLAALVSVGVAGAQSPTFKGKFTLPYQVQWGKAILPAGEYWFSLDPATPSRLTLHRQGHAALFLMPRRISEGNAGKQSVLVIERGDRSTVRALRLAELNVVFEYMAPKTEAREAREGKQPTREIAVSAARD